MVSVVAQFGGWRHPPSKLGYQNILILKVVLWGGRAKDSIALNVVTT